MRLIRFLLIPFSFVYSLIVSLHNFFYKIHLFKIHSVNAKVISVGNITWGGSGKTPAVLYTLGLLSKEGSNVAILTRGYGGDEEKLFTRLTPGVRVMVGKDRVKNGLGAIKKYSVNTLLLDDGFQHRRLKRDLDIVCVDATNPFGNGWMIPVGSMREGLKGLKRADIFLITKVDLVSNKKSLKALEKKLRDINQKAIIVKSVHRPDHFYKLSDEMMMDIEYLKNKNIALLSAIGNPSSFEKTVLSLGLNVKKHFIFRDHYWYKKKDLKKVDIYCKKNGIDAVIVTEKDAIKLQGAQFKLQNAELFVLSIKLQIIENEQTFNNRLFGIYNS